jgi:hypothetical protein
MLLFEQPLLSNGYLPCHKVLSEQGGGCSHVVPWRMLGWRGSNSVRTF